MCWSICPKGFFANDTAGACQVCNVQLNCTSCILVGGTTVQCTACTYGNYFQSNTSTCSPSCATYQYKNTWNNSCNTCNAGCGNCNGPSNTSCIDCRANYYLLVNSSGGYCLSTCPTVGSYMRWIKCTMVLFPEPDGPTKATD